MKQTNSKMQYKRFIMLLGTILIIAVETAMFACLWYNYYANRELRHMRKYFRYFYYYRRGHWTVIVLYAVVLILFMKVLGGLDRKSVV